MITAIGNPVYDLIKTQYVDTKGRVLSGCSTNACLVTSKLGLQSALVGSIGKDFHDQFIADMKKFGIDYEINLCEESGGFGLVYDEKGDRTLTVLGRADDIETFPERFLDSDWIVFGSILQEIPIALVEEIRAKSKAKFFLDPQGFIRKLRGNQTYRENRDDIQQLVSLFDVVKPNEYEAEVMTGIPDARKNAHEMAQKIHSWGCKIAIVTLADMGSVIYDGNKFYDIPAFKTIARDSTGAGDTYAGGFMFESLRNDNLQEIGCFASCVSSIMIENTGPDFELKLEEVERRRATIL